MVCNKLKPNINIYYCNEIYFVFIVNMESSTVPEACFLLGETQFDNSDEFSWRYEARAKP